MRTKKQKLASKINGRKSKGPITPEGKARSSQNAVTHGLHARAVVLAGEDPEKYNRFKAAYIAYWNPQSILEDDLITDIVSSRWRLNRLLATETATIDHEVDQQRESVTQEFTKIDEPTRTALAYSALANEGRTLVVMGRSETRYRRAIDRATDKLLLLRRENREKHETEKEQNKPDNEQPQQNQNAGAIFIDNETRKPELRQ